MTHFSIKVSERLRELGVEGETGIYWKQYRQYTDPWELGEKDEGLLKDFCLPAYRLDDILRLMPQIGEKMGWGEDMWHKMLGGGWCECKNCECGYKEEDNSSTLHSWKYHSMQILFTFLDGDYPKAETYLLGILKQ